MTKKFLRSKRKQKDKSKIWLKLQEEIADDISQYPNLVPRPVKSGQNGEVDYKSMTKKEKRQTKAQACLFGRDLLSE